MQYTIDDLTRKFICPILFDEGWDYDILSKKFHPTYLYGIKEPFKWFYRRAKPITIETITSSINNHALRTHMPFEEKMLLETAIRGFVSSTFYKEMEQPFFNKEITAHINASDIVRHAIPVITKYNKRICTLIYDRGYMSEHEFFNYYDVMLSTVWIANTLDERFDFINLYQNGKEIKLQRFKVNSEHILNSRQTLSKIGKSMDKEYPFPPMLICNNCMRRTECLTSKRLQKR